MLAIVAFCFMMYGMIKLLYPSKKPNHAEPPKSAAYQAFSFIIKFILLAFTALVSFIVLVILGASTGAVSIGSGTYGTPLYRPKMKV